MNVVVVMFVEFWEVLGEMAPYLLFGFFAAGVLSIFLSAETVERHLGEKGFRPVLKASFWGVPMPLCSCSVIPVATSLRKHGASRGSTTAFLLSTPQDGRGQHLCHVQPAGTGLCDLQADRRFRDRTGRRRARECLWQAERGARG